VKLSVFFLGLSPYIKSYKYDRMLDTLPLLAVHPDNRPEIVCEFQLSRVTDTCVAIGDIFLITNLTLVWRGTPETEK
jgi:hypothetical protein